MNFFLFNKTITFGVQNCVDAVYHYFFQLTILLLRHRLALLHPHRAPVAGVGLKISYETNSFSRTKPSIR